MSMYLHPLHRVKPGHDTFVFANQSETIWLRRFGLQRSIMYGKLDDGRIAVIEQQLDFLHVKRAVHYLGDDIERAKLFVASAILRRCVHGPWQADSVGDDVLSLMSSS